MIESPQSTVNKKVISVEDVHFAFGSEPQSKIIDGISFNTSEFEFVSVIGPSGCGKSTLLRIIAGLIKPTGGKVMYYDKEVIQPTGEITFIFQDSALLPWLTNLENVKLGLSAVKMTDNEKIKRSLEVLRKLGLKGFEDAYPNVLSGGMKQRVGVARALVSNPKVILMDEPFSSLDALTAMSLRNEVLSALKDPNIPLRSVILVSHNVEEAAELSDKIVILSNKPSRVKEIKTISIQQPRNTRSSTFQKIVDEVYATLAL
jgi:NitT/TauT family transport system ATP-binding protein